MLSALSRARREARSIECVSNLRQIGMAMKMYLHNHGEFPQARRFAPSGIPGSIVDALSPYLECTSVFVSPVSEDMFKEAGLSYVFNTEADDRSPAPQWLLKNARLPNSPNPHPGGRVAVLFSDGSVVREGEDTEIAALVAENTVSQKEIEGSEVVLGFGEREDKGMDRA